MQDRKTGGKSGPSWLCWAPDQSNSDSHPSSALISHLSQRISLLFEEFGPSRDFPFLIRGQSSLMEMKQRGTLRNSHFGDSNGVTETLCLEDNFGLKLFKRGDLSQVTYLLQRGYRYFSSFFGKCPLMKQIIAECLFWVLEQQVKWIKSPTHGGCILGQGDKHETYEQINI